MRERNKARLLLAQICIYVVMVGGIRLLYAGHLGITQQVHPQFVLRTFYDDMHYPIHLIEMILLCHFIANAWAAAPLLVLLRRSMWIVALQLLFYAVCGWRGEYRALFDIFPYLTLLAGTGFLPGCESAYRLRNRK